MKKIIIAAILFLAMSHGGAAQTFSVSANVLDYLCLGTMNADVSYSLSRRWSITAGARYNPFTYRRGDPDKQFQMRQQSYSIGARLWPWHTWSGWWFAGKLRYQEYSFGGIRSPETREGDRFGAGLYAGYTYMINPHFNIEVGLGVWSGLDIFRCYSCPVCGLTLQKGNTHFILPDDIMISFAYVF
jgi:hypothetical protein